VTDADDGAWWLAGDGHWHEGTPPSGWVQAGDRRWYPHEPPETAEGYARKIESARLRTATVLTAGQSPDQVDDDYADGDDDYDTYGYDYDEDDGLAWSSDYPADDLAYDDDGSEDERHRPAWLMVGVLVALLFVAIGVVGVMAQTNDRTDGEAGPAADTAPSSSTPASSTTTATATTVGGGQPSPAATVAPPVSSPSTTTVPRTPSTTVPRTPSTTVPPPDTTAPPTTAPSPGGRPIREGGRCSNVGATAIANNGTPVTCSTTACDGHTYDEPLWRRTTC